MDLMTRGYFSAEHLVTKRSGSLERNGTFL